ncbi:fimbrial protein [Burkholderia ubonensis]|nr:fimbrial protein [Burkholderia ubonensis]
MHAWKQTARALRHRAMCAIAAMCAAGVAYGKPPDPSVTVKFTGTYNSTTCTVADDDQNKRVDLPTISTAALTTAGETRGETPFTLSVRCDSDVGKLIAYFQSGPTTNTNGNLDVENPSDPTSATGVQVQLTNGDGTPIKIGDASTMKPVAVSASTPTPIPFVARYYATGRTGPGKVSTYVTFVLQML